MNKQRRFAEYRANIKGIEEQREDLRAQLNELLSTVKAEKRAFSDDENETFDKIEKEINLLDKTIDAETRAAKFECKRLVEKKEAETRAESEERAFESYIRSYLANKGEVRADANLTHGDNGAVIPATIANKIIETLSNICPIYERSTKYDVSGSLSIPYYDEDSQEITMAYAEEFSELESTSGKFGSITLSGFLAGVLTKVSKKLINNSQFNLTAYVVRKVAEAAKKWIEKECIVGTNNKVTGLNGVKANVTAASATAVTSDELIDTQEAIHDEYQADAIWIMNKKTRTAIRKLKDSDGNYLLNRDLSSKWGYTLLGKDVYISDVMPTMVAGKVAIYYGDFSGLATKTSEQFEMQILLEKYATQHAIGVVGWIEFDAKVENAQKLSKLTMKSA